MESCDDTVVIRIGGEGGEGTITLGDIFTRIAARSGLEVYSFRTYPAEIKGDRHDPGGNHVDGWLEHKGKRYE